MRGNAQLPARLGAILGDPAERVGITIDGAYAQEWDDAEGHISIVRGHCRVQQGSTILEAQKMVIWRSTQSVGKGKRDRLTIYLEDDVRIEEPGSTVNDSPMIVTLNTRAGIKVGLRLPWFYYVARTIQLDQAFVVQRGVPGLSFAINDGGRLKRVLVSTSDAAQLVDELRRGSSGPSSAAA